MRAARAQVRQPRPPLCQSALAQPPAATPLRTMPVADALAAVCDFLGADARLPGASGRREALLGHARALLADARAGAPTAG